MRVLRVNVVPKGTCACKMRAGDARRVAAGVSLVGYYLGCPSCGMVNVALADEYEIAERPSSSGVALLALAPGAVCSRCGVTFQIADSVFEVDHVPRAG